MANTFENQETSFSGEKPEANKKEDGRKNHFDAIKKLIEYEIGKTLPEDKEELFRNFDDLIPKEIDHVDIADKVKAEDKHASLYRYTRKGIKSSLEEELYGSTMKDVEDYFRSEIESVENQLDLWYRAKLDPELVARHDKCVDLFNQISSGSIGNPLAEIELQISNIFTTESEKNILRKFAERLSAEIYKGRKEDTIEVDDIKKHIEKESMSFSSVEDENIKSDNEKHYKSVLDRLRKGELSIASEEIESNIGWIQERLEERKNKDLKDVSEKALKERYGENFMPAVNIELRKLRGYRKFLKSKESDQDKKEQGEEKYQPENEQVKEKLEGEKLFQYQIENNSHSIAKDLQENMILFIRSIDRGIGTQSDFQYIKDELAELLYRCGVEYSENKEVKIDKKDREILQPVLDFRREMDSWNTLSEIKTADFRKRLVGYMKDEFGIETENPNEGEDYKNKAKATKIEETKNEFLNDRIKRVLNQGFKINENLFTYYEKWYKIKNQDMQDKWKGLDSPASRQEFDKVRREDDMWLKKYNLKKVIRQAEVEVYRYKV